MRHHHDDDAEDDDDDDARHDVRPAHEVWGVRATARTTENHSNGNNNNQGWAQHEYRVGVRYTSNQHHSGGIPTSTTTIASSSSTWGTTTTTTPKTTTTTTTVRGTTYVLATKCGGFQQPREP